MRTGTLAAILIVGIAAVIAIGVVGFAAGHYTRSTKTVTVAGAAAAGALTATVDPHVAGGAHDFVQFACAQCHGSGGQGGVSPYVPALTRIGKTLTASQLRSIIDHGLGESANPTKPYMPVWGEVVSKRQVNDLVA